jgi:hypothetical protein
LVVEGVFMGGVLLGGRRMVLMSWVGKIQAQARQAM